MKVRRTLSLLAFMSLAVGASAQDLPPSPIVLGRLDALGGFAGDAPFCQAMGYVALDPGGQAFSEAVARYAERTGVAPKDAEAAVLAAKTREAADIGGRLDAVKAGLKDANGDKALRDFADELSAKCRRASDDPVGSILLQPPTGDVSDVSRRFVDGLLAPFGRAGWQNEYILAAGELARAVGACEPPLTRGQVRSYLAEMRDPTRFPPDINDTVQAYFDQRVASGREAARTAKPSAAQCRQLLARKKAALDKAPVE